MEKQFFTWESWDKANTLAMQFNNCVLKQDVGTHKVGDKIPSIGAVAARETVIREHEEAEVRGVACSNPTCWCVPIRKLAPEKPSKEPKP